MCNAKALGTVALLAVGVATGGFGFAAAGAAGAAGAASAGAAAAGAAGAAGASVGGMIGAAGLGSLATTTATTAAAGGLSAIQTAALISSVAGTGMSAYGQYQQAKAGQVAARYNQKVADIQKQDALDRGDFEQQQVGARQAQIRGRQRVALAANGVDLDSGTPAALLDQTDYYGLEDQRTVANNARREAAGYGARSTLAGLQADVNPYAGATGSLLSNAGAVADKWYRYRRG